MTGRHWLSVACLAVLLASLAACLGQRTYFGEPLDPKAPNIVPFTGLDAATIATHANPPDAWTPGLEGAVLFIRLTDGGGNRILDRPFGWPTDEQSIPPGSYSLSAYWMGCNGSCATLSAEAPAFCQVDITAVPRLRIEVEITPRSLAPGTTCIVR